MLGDNSPPMLTRGTRWQEEECVAGAADGIVLPGETCVASIGEDLGGGDGRGARADACA